MIGLRHVGHSCLLKLLCVSHQRFVDTGNEFYANLPAQAISDASAMKDVSAGRREHLIVVDAIMADNTLHHFAGVVRIQNIFLVQEINVGK